MEPVEPNIEMRFICLYFIGVRAIMRTSIGFRASNVRRPHASARTFLSLQFGELGVFGRVGEAFESEVVAVGVS